MSTLLLVYICIAFYHTLHFEQDLVTALILFLQNVISWLKFFKDTCSLHFTLLFIITHLSNVC